MVCCLCQRKNLLLLAEGISLGFFQFLSGMRRLFLKTVLFDHSGSIPMERAVSQERICQQAERLLASYGNSVLQLAYSYLHNISDAEEVLQDTLVQFLKTAPVLEHKEHEKAWFLRVAANLSKNRIKYNAVRRTDELEEELADEGREDLSFVWEAVKALPQKYREVIHLFYHEGYSCSQISQILCMKENTVYSYLQRGRSKLKEILKEGYGLEETI